MSNENPASPTTARAAGPLDVERLIQELTLEEKASLTSGLDFWHTQPVDRAGAEVPAVMVTDGPHGLRKQSGSADHLGLANSVPATCFPTAAALGSTWNVELLERVGRALGRETRANDVAVLLGPGINIKRSPLCGRNFEYFSEDPVVSGDLGAALINGVQSQGVGTSLKHFAANNQETDRMRVSADVDERTLREIYLTGFERAVTKASPWTVMCSYNKINGTYASEDHWLLTEVLRDEWGYDGVVVSDWGAVSNRVPALAAGLDLEMPATGGRTDAEVVAAVRAGELDEAILDQAVRRHLTLLNRALPALAEPGTYDVAEHHALAREAAAEGAVLLRNEPVDGAPVLPLDPAAASSIAVIGEFARTPRYQGAGSSQVQPTRLDDALTQINAITGSEVSFAAGFGITAEVSDADDAALREEAVALARDAGTVVLFLGLPASHESEGFDRDDMDLPANQIALLEAVSAVCARVVVVLANGSAVAIAPWQDRAAAILEGWLGGQAGGGAIADLLFGVRNPSGKLTETVPVRLEDNASYGNFPGELGHVRYGEGVLVGYRYYDAKRMDVAFPFGHGLSYTTFAYDDLSVAVSGEGTTASLTVDVTVTNTGDVAGAEVVQVYVGDPQSAVERPERELKAFGKVSLAPGGTRTLTFELDARDLSYWHPVLRRWVVEGGEFVVSVGASSRDLRGSATVTVVGEDVTLPLTPSSTLSEALAHPVAGAILRDAMAAGDDGSSAMAIDESMLAMAGDMPLRVIAAFDGMMFDQSQLEQLLAAADAG
ncbi:glycoside hydrolase family 3 C-terminal domain-containing protein [Oerskovia merdavium]|uniref:Glycoside hydrolase family 3 C-terminal domain-containing protein n=1 Tax=Oerskovia merdavium TaxID=2762227 RepID=A0ABR8TVD1_9CELL|nr:glycoside hydrolase family 3 C-terminal domain-containing protein [Oerskovia merdavium]MBD7979746.1 glycoside hydrolase family 3 C-terminal domain-containing protein [Oerskovia merdavium]